MVYDQIQSQFCARPFKYNGYLSYYKIYFICYLLNVRVDPSIKIKFFDKLMCTFE